MLWCVLEPEGVFYHVVVCLVTFRLQNTATLLRNVFESTRIKDKTYRQIHLCGKSDPLNYFQCLQFVIIMQQVLSVIN